MDAVGRRIAPKTWPLHTGRVPGPARNVTPKAPSVQVLVNDLLDVGRLQQGKLHLRLAPVDLVTLVAQIVEAVQLDTQGQQIIFDHEPEPLVVMADSVRLEQIVVNLLSNAIKYAPDAKTVEVELSAYDEVVTIQVTDHGLGIPREQRDKIFERFYRATGSKQKAISGLGMGLYIVAEIVKRHGGTITVDSAIGKGSTFTVTLPRTPGA